MKMTRNVRPNSCACVHGFVRIHSTARCASKDTRSRGHPVHAQLFTSHRTGPTRGEACRTSSSICSGSLNHRMQRLTANQRRAALRTARSSDPGFLRPGWNSDPNAFTEPADFSSAIWPIKDAASSGVGPGQRGHLPGCVPHHYDGPAHLDHQKLLFW